MYRFRLVFVPIVVVTALSVVGIATPASAAPGDLTLASTSETGVKGDAASSEPIVSADGTKVAFNSNASNLHPDDTDHLYDVYVKDLATGTLRLVSISETGTKGNANSYLSSLSADGTKIGFSSIADNLHPEDIDGFRDVYVRDMGTGTLTLVSTSETGTKANANSYPSILSADGTKVAFFSSASNLHPDDPDGIGDVFVKDLISGSLTLVSTSQTGAKGSAESYVTSLSSDGTKVGFHSYASNLDPNDTDARVDVYVKDVATGTLTLASTTETGVKSNGFSDHAIVSADGTAVGFFSNSTNLDVADTDGVGDVYVKDLVTGTLTLASTSAAGSKGSNFSFLSSLSSDGTKVGFDSQAGNLHPNDTDSNMDVYVKDLVTGDLTLASISATGTKSAGQSSQASLSADGTEVAFISTANNLDPADTDFISDVYVKELGDSDGDGDGVADTTDNCPDASNPAQVDGDGDGIGDVCDDSDLPMPDLAVGNVAINEAAGTANLIVTLSRADHGGVLIDYVTSNGTATSGQDYVATTGRLLIPAGQTTGIIPVSILNDSTDEPFAQDFSVQLANPVGANIVDRSGSVTIRDNDGPTSALISDAVVLEGNTGSRPIVFTLRLAAPSEKTVSISFATANATAVAPSDYTARSGTVRFLPMQTTQTVQVIVRGDRTREQNETLTLRLRNARQATLQDSIGIGSITNDD